ncbi:MULTISPECIES: flavin reductase family protein [Streptomyces]|uniref:Flavin reductase family protein n=1 Tax=Streptomyces doudnae TaxID=3075536 RepID=A0ABD5F0D7_9ACTN|nr:MULTISPECIES: flavin reductase family protein [unclassified Streptomyces]MDT0440271.1 flavin reductase family protein [Streptomyces sp. DSM 41981]SCD29384.1 NADH-FMN oxidoreductase RutF, flavin reductase (DIM6/NTAB) family [Streptomyces sp. SolWspMP-5a-2]
MTTRTIQPDSMTPEETYRLLSGVVVPRPIAWVASRSGDGVMNLAPFSCFTFVSNAPPMIGINVGRKGAALKDTGNNIHETGEFVVHIADETLIEPVHHSAAEHPPHVDEAGLLQLDTIPSLHVRVPRLIAPPIALECELHAATAYGETGSEFIVGIVRAFHVREDLLTDGKIDTALLAPIARLGGPLYAGLGPITRMTPVGQTPKATLPSSADIGKATS